MSHTTTPVASVPGSEARLVHVLDQYLAALQRGDRPDSAMLLAEHPDLAEDLQACLASLEFIHRAAVKPVEPDPDSGETAEAAVVNLGVLGDFRLLREVGRGGMGVVYEAEQISLGRRVALKILPFAAALDSRHLQRFKVEAQAAAHLHHTHIVPVFIVGVERGVHYYAMQFIEGRTVAEVISELRHGSIEGQPTITEPVNGGDERPSPVPGQVRPREPASTLGRGSSTRTRAFFQTAAELGIQAAEALDFAHSLGVVHRDIKPANLLVDDRGKLWITDFGLARFQEDIGLTMTGDLLGTLRYMSPEQALVKQGVVDHRTDIYSLGVTLYELLTLRSAVEGGDRQEILRRIAEQEPTIPRRLNPSIPHELETIVLKAMNKEATGRYATAMEMADDLRRYLEDKPIKAKRPTVWEYMAKWSRRHAGAVWTALVVLAMAATGLAVGIVLVTRAYRAEASQRLQSEGNLKLAYEVLDDFYVKLAEQRLPQKKDEDRDLLEKAVRFYEQFAHHNETDPKARFEAGRAHFRVASIERLLGRADAAEAALQRGIKQLKALVAQRPAPSEYRTELAVGLNRLGGVLRSQRGQLIEAERVFAEALALCEELVAEADATSRARALLANCLCNLGTCQFDAGRLSEAEVVMRRAIAIDAKLVEETPRDFAMRMRLGRLLHNLALLKAGFRPGDKRGDPEQALELLKRAIVHHQAARDSEPKNKEYNEELFNAYSLFGGVQAKLGRKSEAIAAEKQALAISEILAHDYPNVPEFRWDVAASQGNLGNYLAAEGKLNESERSFRQALEILDALVREFPAHPRYRSNLAGIHENLGSLLRDRGRLEEATGFYRRAVELLERTVVEFPQLPNARDQLAQARKTLDRLTANRPAGAVVTKRKE